MDRNTLFGILLIVGIVLTWSIFFAPKNEPTKDQPNTPGVTTPAPADTSKPAVVDTAGKPVPDSVWATMSDSARQAMQQAALKTQWGAYTPVVQGTADSVHVITDNIDAWFSTKGATVEALSLRKYVTWDSSALLPIVTRDSFNEFTLAFDYPGAKGGTVFSRDIYFKPDAASREIKLTGDESKALTFTADFGGGKKLDFIYTFKGNSYDFDFDVRLTEMQELATKGQFDIFWQGLLPKTEKALTLMREKAALQYRTGTDVETLNPRDNGVQEVRAEGATDWIAFKSQYFAHMIMTNEANSWERPSFKQTTPAPPDPAKPDSNDVVRLMEARIPVAYAGDKVETRKFKFFTGPLEYHLLRGYNRDFDGLINLGWGPLKWINKYFIVPVFDLLQKMTSSYGLIILILAILIKLVTYPFTYKTIVSSTKMRLANQMPEMKELEEKYKNDNTTLQQKKMAKYREMGASPFGGCLPMLLSYPFIISLFFLFPNAIELRQVGFLWADDLSTYDSIYDLGFSIPMYGDHVSLFTLLMTISIFAYTWINQKLQPQMNTNPVLKYMPYFMPILFLGFLNNYSAGLSYYYLLSNLLAIAQTQLTRVFMNEEKLLEKMREDAKKKAKDGKKSGVTRWIEQAQKRQEEMRKTQSNGRKK